MKKVVFIVVAGLFAACSPKLMMPKQSDVESIVAAHPNYNLADMKEGRQLYSQHCGTCHALKSPTSRKEDGWNSIVPIMVKKVNQKGKVAIINQQDSDKILQYLVAMSANAK